MELGAHPTKFDSRFVPTMALRGAVLPELRVAGAAISSNHRTGELSFVATIELGSQVPPQALNLAPSSAPTMELGAHPAIFDPSSVPTMALSGEILSKLWDAGAAISSNHRT